MGSSAHTKRVATSVCSKESYVTPGMEESSLNPPSGSDSSEELGNILSTKMTGVAESGKGGESIPHSNYLHETL